MNPLVKRDDPRAEHHEMLKAAPHGNVELDARVLMPFLVLMEKFMRCVDKVELDRVTGRDMTVQIHGMSADEFNTLRSLTNSLGREIVQQLHDVDRVKQLESSACPVCHKPGCEWTSGSSRTIEAKK